MGGYCAVVVLVHLERVGMGLLLWVRHGCVFRGNLYLWTVVALRT